MEDLLHWAKRFIATPSVSRDGNRAIADLAAELLDWAGLDVRREQAPGSSVDEINVVAEAGPETGRDLLLVTHLDTVPPGDAVSWTATGGDPFRPTQVGNRLYGLGSADAKVDLVCKAFALARTDLQTLQRRVRVVGTFGEEIGQRGVRHLIETGGTRGLAFALVGEPSELVGIRAHKGYAVFEGRIPLPRIANRPRGRLSRLELRGSSAHSSTPHLGRNAVEAALERLAGDDVVGVASLNGGDTVNRVPDRCAMELWLRGPAAEAGNAHDALEPGPLVAFLRAWRDLLGNLQECRDPEFDPDHTVGNLGRIQLEGTEAVVTFDLRPIPGVDPETAAKPLARLAHLTCLRVNPPLSTPEDSVVVRAVLNAQESAGLAPRIATKATSTEAGLLGAAGIEAVVLGPGRSVGNVHRPNEHTRISELALAVKIYSRAVEQLCIEEVNRCSS
jgi:succinyl-diaminopimelate desuccinylase